METILSNVKPLQIPVSVTKNPKWLPYQYVPKIIIKMGVNSARRDW